MRDFANNVTVVSSITPKVASGTTDLTGAHIDRKGYESVTHVVAVGVSGDTLSGSVKLDLILEHADADGSGSPGSYSAVSSGEDVLDGTVTAGGIFTTIDSLAEDDVVVKIGYRGNKRFSRVKVDLTGTHANGTPVAAVALLGHGGRLPE